MKNFYPKSLLLPIALFLSASSCILLSSCATHQENDSPATQAVSTVNPNINEKYVGEWWTNALVAIYDGKHDYEIMSIWLNADGTATYHDQPAEWVFKEEDSTITITLIELDRDLVFEAKEWEGKPFLRRGETTYSRPTDLRRLPDD